MTPNYILYAIPVFFLLIGVEAIYSRQKHLHLYRFTDAINDLSMGVSQQIFGGVLALLGFSTYVLVYQHARLLELPESHPLTWVAAFILLDLCYYWLHRMSHTINILWGGHAPHHQSEEYNLAVALRQGALQGPLTIPFYLPMAVLGFSPLVYFSVAQLNTIYQFWIHTRAIDKMGPLEAIFNTPSHHRVHHGKNPRYLDRNHAGMFIVWDKLFGTFVPEDEEPVYGTIEPLRSWNPLYAQFQFMIYLFKQAWASPNRFDLVRIWFMRAGWTPQNGLKEWHPDEKGAEFLKKYDPPMPAGLGPYVLLQFVVVVAVAVAFLMFSKKVPTEQALALALTVFLGLTCLGGMMEARRWAWQLELVRLLTLPAMAVLMGGTQAGMAAGVLTLFSLPWIWTYRGVMVNAAGPLPSWADTRGTEREAVDVGTGERVPG